MKKIFILTCATIMATSTLFAQTWSLDKVHSRVGFEINFLTVSDVGGSFRSVDATVNASKADFSDAVVDLTADVNSLNTEFDQRDEVLKGTDFFDVAQYGQLAFKSKSIKRIKGNTYALAGDLTLHGVTKPVVLQMTYNGTTTNPTNKKIVAGFKVTGAIKRSDFRLGASFPASMLADVARLDANILLNAN